MKSRKRFIIPLIAIVLLLCAAAVIYCTYSKSKNSDAAQKTMLQYTYENLTFEKPESEEYECEVTNNDKKYITIDAYNDGEYYWLTVRSNKATKKQSKPIITVYQEKDGKKTIIKKYTIIVTPVKKVKMSNIKINKGTEREIILNNPCEKYYDFKYDKKIIRITQNLYADNKEYHTLEGLKKGKTTVKAYLEGTKKLIGSFTVTVGDYKASVKKSYQNVTVYYNPHMDSRWLNGGCFDLGEAISNYHANSSYSVEAANSKLIGIDKSYSDGSIPKSALIYSEGTGKTKLTVYEKNGKSKKKKIGTITLTIKNAKDSEVFDSNMSYDNDGLSYENFICPGDTYDLKNAVVGSYINNDCSHFKESEYTFSAKSNHPEIISVDKNGICTCHSLDYNGGTKVTYTVMFKDGSKVTNTVSFDIVEEDFF